MNHTIVNILNSIGISALVLIPAFLCFLYTSKRNKEARVFTDCTKTDECFDDALTVVMNSGYKVLYYIPEIGVDQNDKELVAAIRYLHKSGHIITDERGGLVGNLDQANG